MPHPLACKVSSEKSSDSFMGISLHMTPYFSLAAFIILSLHFAILIMTCLDVGLFGFILFGTLCAFCWAFLVAQLVKNPPAKQETPVQFLGQENPLEKRQATHSSILGLSWWVRW